MLKNAPMENLCTAELWFSVGDMKMAVVFANRARGKLPQGSADWQRAATSSALWARLPPSRLLTRRGAYVRTQEVTAEIIELAC